MTYVMLSYITCVILCYITCVMVCYITYVMSYNFRVAYTRFLAFSSDNHSGLHDGETPAKWQSKANFATHPSTETEWPPKLLTRFSS